jgi:Bacterial PH domain
VSAKPAQDRVVIKISPMAHLAVGFLAIGLLALVLSGPSWTGILLIIPIGLSAYIARSRTVADRETVTARTLLGSETVPWDEVHGLKFSRGSSAYAHLTDGRELRLPAVTFATLPLLTDASGGRVPNPYSRED